MMKFFSFIAIIVLVSTIAFTYRDPLTKAKNYFEGKLFPCAQPVTYSLGTIDPKFGLSNSQAIKDLTQASQLWNDADHKTLFEYKPTGGEVLVNFVYDYRQDATIKLKSLGLTINDDENTYNSLKAKYDTLHQQYITEKAQLDAEVANYKEQVAYWNARGGAPKSEYDKLNAEAAKIQQDETSFNQLVDNLNALAQVLNQLIAQLNLKVNNYNSIGSSQGGEFEEGVFRSSLYSQEIDIYQFDDQTKLLRVLTHELGHALGLEHVGDPDAIMYKLNQGKSAKLATADLNALQSLCSSKFNLSNFNRVTP